MNTLSPTAKGLKALIAAFLSVALVFGTMPSLDWAAEGENAANGFGAAAALEDPSTGEGENPASGDSDDPDDPGDEQEDKHVAGLSYKAYFSKWKPYVSSGTAGSSSGSDALKALVIKKSADTNVTGGMSIKVNKRGKGWSSAVGLGKVAGDKKAKIQAISLQLTGEWANLYDVQYRVNVPGYGWMGWSKNGQTSGTIGLARTIRGFQVKLVKKGSAVEETTAVRYATKKTNLDPFAKVVLKSKISNCSSATKYIIVTNTVFNRTAVFKGSKGKWTLKKLFACSCGKPSTPTRKGTYDIKERGKSFNGVDKGKAYTCWYWTQYSGDYLFHSVLYKQGSKTKILDGRLGESVSHGCVRLSMADAKWIYDTVPRGSKAVLY